MFFYILGTLAFANMSDFQSNLLKDDDDVMEMVPDDCDYFVNLSKTILKSFEEAFGDDSQPLLENMTSGSENYRHLYQSAMNEYGDAMKARIIKSKQSRNRDAYR